MTSLNRNCVLVLLLVLPFSQIVANPEITTDPETKMVIKEYKVVDSRKAAPGGTEYFEFMDSSARAARTECRKIDEEENSFLRIDKCNSILSIFGYSFVPSKAPTKCSPAFDLLKGDSTVIAPICQIQHLAVSSDKTAFLFTAIFSPKSQNNHYFLFHNLQTHEWNPSDHDYTAPCFWGNAIIHVDRLSKEEYNSEFAVRVDTTVVYRFSGSEGPSLIVKSFSVWKTKWILELAGRVIVNGTDLGKVHNYSEIFSYLYLGNNPFYFFKRDNCIQMSFGDKVLAPKYEQVIHDRCCEPAAFNIAHGSSRIWFHALRSGFWYFVVIEAQ